MQESADCGKWWLGLLPPSRLDRALCCPPGSPARPHGLMASSPLPAPGTNLLLSHSLSLSGPGLSPPPLTRPLSPGSRSEAGVSRPGPGPPHTASASLSYSRLVLPRPGKQISTNCCNLNIINHRKAERGCFRRNVTRGHCSSDANIQWRS